jgi:hypothetical protein
VNVEDQLRAAGRDITESVRELPRLTLPSQGPRRVARERRPRRWRAVLVPLTAAVAVLAVAIVLVAVRNLDTSRPTRPATTALGATAAVPRYYLALTSVMSPSPRKAVVGDSRTSRVLATISPPHGGSFSGVTAAADDRTFLLDDQLRITQPAGQPLSDSVWYLLRVTPGAAHPAALSRLLRFSPGPGTVLGVALSPDGRELALMVQSAAGVGLRIYSVATEKTLHWWTTPNELGSDIPGMGENTLSLAWTPDGRDLTFTDTPQTITGGPQVEDVRRLSVANSGRDLLADSQVIFRLPWPSPFMCTNALVTAGGGSVVCGTNSQYVSTPTRACVRARLDFVRYTLAIGKLTTRVLATHVGPCAEQAATALWVAPSGKTTIGLLWTGRAGTSLDITDTLGLVANGRFTPLASAGVSQSGTAQPGDIAF